MSRRRLLVAGLGLALLLGALLPRGPATGDTRSRSARLLGPLAALARDVEWIRFQRARLDGRPEHALLCAERAVRLDPRSTEGWLMLATHLALEHGSPERTPDRARRRRFLDAGLETLRRGATHADDPGELALWRGLILLSRAEVDPLVDAGGAPALLAAAGRAFEEAHAAGHAEAAALRDYARELATETGR